ncbi:polycomb group RING finger protein 6 isoform X3 [Mobula birostris]|uniref:polycomb group RING finger protein 6 isoform X3 n=1 Tax=Mobula birostris TaxID=1983395 RepID=UPI003B28206C
MEPASRHRRNCGVRRCMPIVTLCAGVVPALFTGVDGVRRRIHGRQNRRSVCVCAQQCQYVRRWSWADSPSLTATAARPNIVSWRKTTRVTRERSDRLRLDRKLQDIVYKLVPNLESSEKRRLHEFYRERGLEVPKPVVQVPGKSKVRRIRSLSKKLSLCKAPPGDPLPHLDICLVLEFIGADLGIGDYKPLQKKYVRVSEEATVRHVEKFIRMKLELDPIYRVDIICGNKILEHHQTLRHIRRSVTESGIRDGLLILHYGLVHSQK